MTVDSSCTALRYKAVADKTSIKSSTVKLGEVDISFLRNGYHFLDDLVFYHIIFLVEE